MITGTDRKAEALASLNVTEALLIALQRKGLLSEEEIEALLTEVSDSLGKSPLVQVKCAADIVRSMRDEARQQPN